MQYALTLTNGQYSRVRDHLFAADGLEGVAILLCGRAVSSNSCRFTVHQVHLVPHKECTRTELSVKWPTSSIEPLLKIAEDKGLAVVKIHGHRVECARFSSTDDNSDRELFPSIYAWMDNELPHGSAVILNSGEVIFRVVNPDGQFQPGRLTAIVGDDLRFFHPTSNVEWSSANQSDIKNAQAFGPGTISLLKKLRIGVVGCSGLGAPTIEQLARLGVGELVLVDPDRIEEKNLNRITHSKFPHVDKALKVDVLREAIESIGLGTKVDPHPYYLHKADAIRALASCDVIFGCVDSIDGRHLLSRLCTFYSIPYFDIGVKLEADGKGGIEQICGSVNYLQPGKSNFITRGVFTSEQLNAALLARSDPEKYEQLRREKYIAGVDVERPAVISVNYLYSSLGINEFLARIHQFRIEPNANFAQVTMSISIGDFFYTPETDFPASGQEKNVGRGDMNPLLDMVL